MGILNEETLKKKLIVILGPTGVGKTSVAITIAKRLSAEIISSDSRQLYHQIPIGTAAPDSAQLAEVKHHFIGTLELEEYYSAAQFEQDAMQLLPTLFSKSDYVVMCGGSMMYIDALCNGIDNIPTISDEIRNQVVTEYNEKGLEYMCEKLKALDPEYYAKVDLQNHKRIVHAIEICLQSGTTYTSLRSGVKQERPFDIIKIGLNIPRPELFERINKRVEIMVEDGLLAEAEKMYPLRHLNSLNTVGYKELFAYFDGAMDLTTAIERIKKNSRLYAKKQLTWFKRDSSIQWLTPTEAAEWSPEKEHK